MKPMDNILPEDDATFEALQALADKVNPNPQFKSALEADLKSSHRPRASFHSTRRDVLQFAGLAVALTALAFFLNWAFHSVAPIPLVGGSGTATPVTEKAMPTPTGQEYDYNGTKLYLNAPLPDAPSEANIYTARPDQPATIESARALASRFGIEGQVYVTPGELPDTTNFMVTAGGPRIYVRSDNYFSYHKNYGDTFIGSKTLTDEQAAAAIDAFLKSHGFDFEYQIEHAPQIYGEYYVVPQLDGLPLRYDYLMPARLDILLDDSGQVLSVYGALLNTDKVGAYGIRTAEEAFQQILNNAQVGVEQGMRSAGMLDEKVWFRQYPDNQAVILYDQVSVLAAAESGQSPLITVNDQVVTGNTAGLEALQEGVFVEASGQFVTENSIRTFRVDKWKYTSAQAITLTGTFQKDGDQVYFDITDTSDPNAVLPARYLIPNPPDDLPFNTNASTEQVMLSGVSPLNESTIEWTMIQYFPAGGNGGGGGGGGGHGFYQLNLTGTPMPLPTAEPAPQSTNGESPSANAQTYVVQDGDTLAKIASDFGISVDELMHANGLSDTMVFVGQTLVIPSGLASTPQAVEGQRGILSVNIYNQAGGGQRVKYGLATGDPIHPFMRAEGENLGSLQDYQNRPVDIWGTVDHIDENGIPIVKVDRFEIPYPDLKFQVLKGTEKTINIQDQTALLFTSEDGKSYVQLAPNCSDVIGPESVVGTGQPGEPLLLEALIIPDLTFGDYPAICVFSTSMAVNPKNGQPMELTVTADQPTITTEQPGEQPTGSLPTATMTIEKVELVYYISDPRYAVADPTADPAYIQPMWRFTGHYNDGSTFEFLVQALRDEFLSPEIQTIQGPG